MNWGMIIIRGLWPAALLMAVTTTVALLTNRVASGLGADRLSQVADWIFALGWVGAVVWTGVFVYRLKRWEAGHGPFCRSCSGPTGFVQPGRVVFGKQLADYRSCFNCGKHTPELT